MQDQPQPALTLNAQFKAHLARKEPFERVIKVLREGESGEDYQPRESMLIIPPEVSTPDFPMDEITAHAMRFGWPNERVTLYLAKAEEEPGAMSTFLSQATLQPHRTVQTYAPRPTYAPQVAPAPQAPAQAPANPADPLAGLSETQRLSLEINKLAAMAAGRRRASVLDRILSGELQPDEVMVWMGNIQRFANFGKLLLEQFVKWLVPMVVKTYEQARADAAKTATKAPPRAPEAAPPPA
jgi:hypothetical protein